MANQESALKKFIKKTEQERTCKKNDDACPAYCKVLQKERAKTQAMAEREQTRNQRLLERERIKTEEQLKRRTNASLRKEPVVYW